MEHVRAGTTFDTGKVHLEVLVSNDEEFVLRATHQPNSPFPPPHLHPAQTETFTVEQGEFLFVLDGQHLQAGPGDIVEIPAGTVHQLRNPTDGVSVVHWHTQPALRTGNFHACLHQALRDEDGAALGACLAEFTDVFAFAAMPDPS